MKNYLILILVFLSGVIFTVINTGLKNKSNDLKIKSDTIVIRDTIYMDIINYNEYYIIEDTQEKETPNKIQKIQHQHQDVEFGNKYGGYVRKRAPIVKQDTVKR